MLVHCPLIISLSLTNQKTEAKYFVITFLYSTLNKMEFPNPPEMSENSAFLQLYKLDHWGVHADDKENAGCETEE